MSLKNVLCCGDEPVAGKLGSSVHGMLFSERSTGPTCNSMLLTRPLSCMLYTRSGWSGVISFVELHPAAGLYWLAAIFTQLQCVSQGHNPVQNASYTVTGLKT